MDNLSLIKKISELDNVQLQINTSATQVSGKEKFVTNVQFGHFDPENMVHNGGPVTKKGLTLNVLGDSFEEAESNALKKVLTFMKLGE